MPNVLGKINSSFIFRCCSDHYILYMLTLYYIGHRFMVLLLHSMRKKARNEELIDIEKKYLRLKELETLQIHRRQRLADFIDKHDVEGCPQYSSVYQLACQELHEPELSMTDTVSLSTGNSGMVKVSIHGIGTESAKPKTMSGVISVDFAPHSTDIVAASLYWSSSTKSIPPSVSFFPSISVLSFVS